MEIGPTGGLFQPSDPSTDDNIPPSQIYFNQRVKLAPIYSSTAIFSRRLKEFLRPLCFRKDFRGGGWTLFLKMPETVPARASSGEDAMVVLNGREGPGVLWRNGADAKIMYDVERPVFVNIRAKRPPTSNNPEIEAEVVCRHLLAEEMCELIADWVYTNYPEATPHEQELQRAEQVPQEPQTPSGEFVPPATPATSVPSLNTENMPEAKVEERQKRHSGPPPATLEEMCEAVNGWEVEKGKPYLDRRSLEAYCNAQNTTPSTLSWWRRKLKAQRVECSDVLAGKVAKELAQDISSRL
jgi:hypothetical protein